MSIRLRKVSQTLVSRGVAGTICASALLCGGVASAGAAPSLPPVPLLTTHVAAVSAPMTNTPASATNAVASCPGFRVQTPKNQRIWAGDCGMTG